MPHRPVPTREIQVTDYFEKSTLSDENRSFVCLGYISGDEILHCYMGHYMGTIINNL